MWDSYVPSLIASLLGINWLYRKWSDSRTAPSLARNRVVARSETTAGQSESDDSRLSSSSTQMLELRERLASLEVEAKAEKRNREDFEEQVRRWQGRVNRQTNRDAATSPAEPTASAADSSDLLQQHLFSPPASPARVNHRRLMRPSR
jgi:hypothetical protein